MSSSEDAEAKRENRVRIPRLKEDKKGQKREWLKRHEEEKRKQKRQLKKARGKQGAPCISEPVRVHEVVLPQDEENVIDNKKRKMISLSVTLRQICLFFKDPGSKEMKTRTKQVAG